MIRSLLILACSQRKVGSLWDRERWAVELYDGPAFRVLRRSGWPNAERGPNTRVMILSAEYGLLSGYHSIRWYDRKMDAARAQELAAIVEHHEGRRGLEALLYLPFFDRGERRQHFHVDEVFVFGGVLYRSVIQAWEGAGLFPVPVDYASGGIGTQLGQLKRWLRERTPGDALQVERERKLTAARMFIEHTSERDRLDAVQTAGG